MRNWFLLTLLLSLLSPWAHADASLTVTDSVVREMLPGGKSTAGYFTLTNHSDKAVRLVAAECSLAGRVELHEHVMNGGMMRMREVTDGIVVKPHSTLTFSPGGYHLMIFKGKKDIKKGASYELTLTFSDNQKVTVKGKVVSVMDSVSKPKHHAHHH